MTTVRRHRRAATKIVFRKTCIAVVKRGKVVMSFSLSEPNCVGNLDAFLRGYAPDLAAHLRAHSR
jgi:hypothetical protein